MTEDRFVRAHVFVEGRVQGVYFRAETSAMAQRTGVAGWVRNLPDGRVEAVFEGSPERVAEAVAWAHHGPDRAVVTRIAVSDETPEGVLGFSVR